MHQHIASILITESHVEAILEQRMTMSEDSRNTGPNSIAKMNTRRGVR